MFSREGDDVSLPCTNVDHPDCSSSTWHYNRAGSNGAIKEIHLGMVKNKEQNNIADRLGLGSNSFYMLVMSELRMLDSTVTIVVGIIGPRCSVIWFPHIYL